MTPEAPRRPSHGGSARFVGRSRGSRDRGGGIADDRGSGSVLAVALVMAAVVIGLSGVGAAAALTARQRTIGSADSAALAAADAASGAIGGLPCQVADGVARGNRVRLVACHADGLEVTVTVVGSFAGIPIEARSRAGPPR